MRLYGGKQTVLSLEQEVHTINGTFVFRFDSSRSCSAIASQAAWIHCSDLWVVALGQTYLIIGNRGGRPPLI